MNSKMFDHSTKSTLLIAPLALRLVQLVVGALLLFAVGPRIALGGQERPGDPRILPPNACIEGRTLTEWNKLWYVFAITDAPINDVPYMNVAEVQVGQVLMLTGNWGTPRSLTLKVGTWVFLPGHSMWGEVYADGSIDDPEAEWLGFLLSAWPSMVTMSTTLDGCPMAVDNSDYFIPITWFDEPIYYAETSSWNSIGGIWFQGYGFMVKPLKPGIHTLTLHVVDDLFGNAYDDSWTLTVVPANQL